MDVDRRRSDELIPGAAAECRSAVPGLLDDPGWEAVRATTDGEPESCN